MPIAVALAVQHFVNLWGVLAQGGVLGIFPEGGSWATLLRPARPGLAYIAEQSGGPVLPISIAGAENVIGRSRRPLRIEFHPPLVAPVIMDKSRLREALDAFDDEVMSVIAQGLPDAQRGKFSSDPGTRRQRHWTFRFIATRCAAGRESISGWTISPKL